MECAEYEICPYNQTHRILKSRYQIHLIKCRKSHPDSKLVKCPFNATHLIKEPELNYHLVNCPDRGALDNYKYNLDTGTSKSAEHVVAKQEPIDCEENWDDMDCKSYDPQAYASSAPILRSNIGALPSEKKRFRMEERLRLNSRKD